MSHHSNTTQTTYNFTDQYPAVQPNPEVNLPNQIDQDAPGNHRMLLMHLVANQILPQGQTDQDQHEATNQGLLAPNHELLEVPIEHLNQDLAVGLVDLVRGLVALGQGATAHGLKVRNRARKAQNRDLKALNPDPRALSPNHRALNQGHLSLGPKAPNRRLLKVVRDQPVEVLRVGSQGRDLEVLLQDQKVQLQDKMLLIADLIHLTL